MKPRYELVLLSEHPAEIERALNNVTGEVVSVFRLDGRGDLYALVKKTELPTQDRIAQKPYDDF